MKISIAIPDSSLMEEQGHLGKTQKIFQVDDHIGVAAAGYIPDARTQVDKSRFFSQSNIMIYDEQI